MRRLPPRGRDRHRVAARPFPRADGDGDRRLQRPGGKSELFGQAHDGGVSEPLPNLASTAGLANNPRAFALKVYSNRLGNGPPSSGDGFTFRGRGLIQLTGRSNYQARATETGLPLVDRPEIASDPTTSVQVAALYWTSRDINDPADADDVREVRKRVNGGFNGLDEAKVFLARAKKALL